MVQVTELGYMGIGVKDPEAWKKFAAELVGSGEASPTPAVTFAEAIAKVKKGTGKELMDAVRVIVHDMKKVEEGLLKDRQAEAERSAIMTMTTSGLGTLMGVAIIIVMILSERESAACHYPRNC